MVSYLYNLNHISKALMYYYVPSLMVFQIISISLFYHCIGMIDMMVEEVGVMKEVIMIDMKGRMICTTREEDIRIVVVEEVIKHFLPKY